LPTTWLELILVSRSFGVALSALAWIAPFPIFLYFLPWFYSTKPQRRKDENPRINEDMNLTNSYCILFMARVL